MSKNDKKISIEEPYKEKEMISVEELHKEIDLIQDCINRMAKNSFLIKGWVVTIVAAIIALTPKEMNRFGVVVTLIMVTGSFWYLDGFFLRTEKIYRELYAWVLKERKKRSREYQYDLNPKRLDDHVERIGKVMFTKTLRWFYFPICIAILLFIGSCSYPCIVEWVRSLIK